MATVLTHYQSHPELHVSLVNDNVAIERQLDRLLDSITTFERDSCVVLHMADLSTLSVPQLSLMLLLAKRLRANGSRLFTHGLAGECHRMVHLLRVHLVIPEYVTDQPAQAGSDPMPIAA
ncbi:hypothetical protein K0504_15680 [Neiella marina]|uniref:STAS domain-containing protein n=1 Tax=Neiella holothuriorum TaxID=2870530 RepID=A0ABS7EJS1_9GAMM|nr:hypothetical protein [Neiella holothuriorum]MBW8192479.1 hypothetical protein [Neiella holothuriorum]